MENENIVKEAALSVAKETVKEVYADTVQPTAKNVGGFSGHCPAFQLCGHVSTEKLNIKYEQKAIAFEKEMEKNTIAFQKKIGLNHNYISLDLQWSHLNTT